MTRGHHSVVCLNPSSKTPQTLLVTEWHPFFKFVQCVTITFQLLLLKLKMNRDELRPFAERQNPKTTREQSQQSCTAAQFLFNAPVRGE